MKKGIKLTLLPGMFMTVTAVSHAKDLKVGYINVLEVFDNYKKTESYDKQLEKMQDDKQKPFKDMADELKKLQDKMEMLKDSEKESVQKQLKEKATVYQKKEKEAFAELKGERDKKMKEIIDDINAAVKKYAKEKNYDFILNETMVVYGDDAANITKTILDTLNGGYTGGSSSSAAPVKSSTATAPVKK